LNTLFDVAQLKGSSFTLICSAASSVPLVHPQNNSTAYAKNVPELPLLQMKAYDVDDLETEARGK
jgi:hypothetical protein